MRTMPPKIPWWKKATKWSPQVKAAIIGAVVIACGWLFFRAPAAKDSNQTTQQNISFGASNLNNSGVIGNANTNFIDNSTKFTQTNSGIIQGQINAPAQPISLTQIYNNYGSSNPPDTGLKEWVTNLSQRTTTNTADIQLTRSDINNLAKLLTKLDDRTSSIEKLPDGRTRLGPLIAGNPYICMEALTNSEFQFNQGDYASALEYAEKGIIAYKGSLKGSAMLVETVLTPKGVAALYSLAARSAQGLSREDLANDYALEAEKTDATDFHKLLLTTTLGNLGKRYGMKSEWSNAFPFFSKSITNLECIKTDVTNGVKKTDILSLYVGGRFAAHALGITNLETDYTRKIEILMKQIYFPDNTDSTK